MKIELPVLYKYTETGAVQQWQIVVEDNTFYTIEGHKGGKLTQSLPTVCYPKNLGKKNYISAEDQAEKEARAKYKKKLEKYSEVLTEGKKFFEPMLAEDAKKVKLPWGEKRVFVQPKLDGLRAINEKMTLMSRNGKPYLSCPHLYQNKVTLDGELYSHDYHDDFNKIVSLCKKQTPTEQEIAESEKMVQFWAYDFPGHAGVFSERFSALRRWRTSISDIQKRMFRIVPTYEVFCQEDIDRHHGENLENGYEGTIIRIDEGPYENKRSKQLLKYKDFTDEEFVIIGAEEGEGGRAGTLGKFNMRHDKDERANFDSNVKGDHKYLKFLWDNKEKYIGKKATVKYFNRTPKKEDGTGDKPRFPYIIKIDRDEYE